MSRFLQDASKTFLPPLTGNNTEAATDTVSGYVSLSLPACTTMARLFFYEDLKVQCVKRNPEHLEMKKKTKNKNTQTNKLLLTSIALFSWLLLYRVMPS